MPTTRRDILREVERLAPQLVSAFDAAWNARDAKALASLSHADADFQFYNGLMLRGRRLIQRVYARSIFPSLDEGLKHETETEHLRLLSETVALGDASVALVEVPRDGASENGGQRRLQRQISATIVLTKAEGRWAISAARLMVPVDA